MLAIPVQSVQKIVTVVDVMMPSIVTHANLGPGVISVMKLAQSIVLLLNVTSKMVHVNVK